MTRRIVGNSKYIHYLQYGFSQKCWASMYVLQQKLEQKKRDRQPESCRKEEEQKLNLASEILFAAFEKGGMQALKDLTIEHAINLYQIIDI